MTKQEKIKTLENTITQLVNIANGRVAFINKNKELYDKKVNNLIKLFTFLAVFFYFMEIVFIL